MLAKCTETARRFPPRRNHRARPRDDPGAAARAPQGERERRLPKETIADLQAAGLFQVLQPRRWGGYEMDIRTYFDVQMALGEGDMSVAWVYGVVGVHPWLIALLDDRARAGRLGQGRHRRSSAPR